MGISGSMGISALDLLPSVCRWPRRVSRPALPHSPEGGCVCVRYKGVQGTDTGQMASRTLPRSFCAPSSPSPSPSPSLHCEPSSASYLASSALLSACWGSPKPGG